VEEYLKLFSLPGSCQGDPISPAYTTQVEYITIDKIPIPQFTNEFWTSRQRRASSIHEISYRACFKPQLPHFFIGLLTDINDVVYDPFSGRGTTVIEAGLMDRRCIANDANPLSRILTRPRFFAPNLRDVKNRLAEIPISPQSEAEIDLSMFYQGKTEAEIVSLREYLNDRHRTGAEDEVDRWIRMVATNRLTGHSKGFFSVYTLPPNQAVSRESQIKINEKRKQVPEYRNTHDIILKKTASLLRTLTSEDRTNLRKNGELAFFFSEDARTVRGIEDGTVGLTVTSPPFLDVVQYPRDNWLRCWFNSIDDTEIFSAITLARTLSGWEQVMGRVFHELFRVTAPGGWVAFEVGEVRKGTIRLENAVVPLGHAAGFTPVCILINRQQFTKTARIWGIDNNANGTNTNRIVLFRKKMIG
jgi:hypothetical protein